MVGEVQRAAATLRPGYGKTPMQTFRETVASDR